MCSVVRLHRNVHVVPGACLVTWRRVPLVNTGPALWVQSARDEPCQHVSRCLRVARRAGLAHPRGGHVAEWTDAWGVRLQRRLPRERMDSANNLNVRLANATRVVGLHPRRAGDIDSRSPNTARSRSTCFLPTRLVHLVSPLFPTRAVRRASRLTGSVLRSSLVTVITSARSHCPPLAYNNCVRVHTELTVRNATRPSMFSVQTDLSRIPPSLYVVESRRAVYIPSPIRGLLVHFQGTDVGGGLFSGLLRALRSPYVRPNEVCRCGFLGRVLLCWLPSSVGCPSRGTVGGVTTGNGLRRSARWGADRHPRADLRHVPKHLTSRGFPRRDPRREARWSPPEQGRRRANRNSRNASPVSPLKPSTVLDPRRKHGVIRHLYRRSRRSPRSRLHGHGFHVTHGVRRPRDRVHRQQPQRSQRGAPHRSRRRASGT